MFLVDTNVISEARKRAKANKGVQEFFKRAAKEQHAIFISVITVGELRRGVELIRHRGDTRQANLLEKWLTTVLDEYQDYILDIDYDVAQMWGRLRAPHAENALDKFIAATALIHNLTVVTRNDKDFAKSGIKILNPFTN